MSVRGGAGLLKRAEKDLRLRWHEVTDAWRDENCRRFEAEHVEPLLRRLRAVEHAMAQMATVVENCRRDCQ